ncbi:hypothetical protein HGRIS_000619 [Hohenbuehelia grisea]|uniref:DUF6534 domain-containing protein n=1 Tax=Hohenbuehelia grisea TaxID=104357 RepID=A0ABR3JTH4_9AGAR
MAWRIRIISRLNWVAALIVLFALISLGGGVWTSATLAIIKRFARKPELSWTWLLASAVADVIITSSLVFSLSKQRTGFRGTDNAINRIIRLTIQTGLVTAIFATLDVVCFLVSPMTALYVDAVQLRPFPRPSSELIYTPRENYRNFVWDFALSKLYTNALISTLNARAGWDNVGDVHTDSNILFGNFSIYGVSTSRRGENTYQTTSRLHAANDLAHSGVDELDAASSPHSRATSVEFGVAITKEVNRIEDPLPVHHSTP